MTADIVAVVRTSPIVERRSRFNADVQHLPILHSPFRLTSSRLSRTTDPCFPLIPKKQWVCATCSCSHLLNQPHRRSSSIPHLFFIHISQFYFLDTPLGPYSISLQLLHPRPAEKRCAVASFGPTSSTLRDANGVRPPKYRTGTASASLRAGSEIWEMFDMGDSYPRSWLPLIAISTVAKHHASNTSTPYHNRC